MDNKYWYISSYPKSGNTWCRIFISEYLNALNNKEDEINNYYKSDMISIHTGEILSSRSWIDDQLGISSSDLTKQELDKVRPLIGLSTQIFDDEPRYHKVHDSFYKPLNKNKYLVPTLNCKGVIYLIRNPADVAVSLSHFLNISYVESVDFMTSNNSALGGSEEHLNQQVYQFLGNWSHHVDSWTLQKEIPLLIIRYEDLIFNPETNFKKILKFIQLPIVNSFVSKIAIDTKFNKLREKENLYGFHEKPNSCKNFFRSGKIGQGVKKLPKEQYEKIIVNFYKNLKKFCYT